MTEIESRATQITVVPKGEEIFSERATVVTVADDGGGEFLEIEQSDDCVKPGTIRIDPEEWGAIKLAVESLINTMKK